MHRREFLQTTGVVAAGVLVGLHHGCSEGASSDAQTGPLQVQLPELPYAPDALAPAIGAQTLRLHHGKHHAGYVKKFNTAAQQLKTAPKSLEALFQELEAAPAKLRTALRNNGGGHWNHSLYWRCLQPQTGTQPEGKLREALLGAFGDLATFRDAFLNAGGRVFGSGWVWLVAADDKLAITTTPNQDNPLMPYADLQGTPLLGLDVWEHAYYLDHQNRRNDYLSAIWGHINWETVAGNLPA